MQEKRLQYCESLSKSHKLQTLNPKLELRQLSIQKLIYYEDWDERLNTKEFLDDLLKNKVNTIRSTKSKREDKKKEKEKERGRERKRKRKKRKRKEKKMADILNADSLFYTLFTH